MPWPAPRPTAALVVLIGLCLVPVRPALGVGSVVISQVWGGTSSTTGIANQPKADYIELFNRTASPVLINGWSINIGQPASATWNKHDLPNGTIPPFSYYLVQVSPNANFGFDLPAPDTILSTPVFATLNNIGKVALRNTNSPIGALVCPTPDSTLVDFVNFGNTGTCFEGGGRAPSGSMLGAGLAIFRGAGGCTDTDNNIADFTTAPPAPRNSHTPAAAGCISGACCNNSNAACLTVLGASACAAGSTYQGDGTTCSPSPCPATGSCCSDCTFACTLTTMVACESGSTWTSGNVCSPNPCPNGQPPANDSPCSAVPLTLDVTTVGQVGTASITGDGVASTCEPQGGKGVWYSFAPAATGYYSIATCGANFDDVLTVFAGECGLPGAFAEVACDDDACAGGAADPVVCGTGDGRSTAARIDLALLSTGNTYLIRVQALTETSVGGTFPILVTRATGGACCEGNDHSCTIARPGACPAAATYQGDGTTCAPGVCAVGACCASGACTISTLIQCPGGGYLGDGTTCGSGGCPDGACCFGSTCLITTPSACTGANTVFAGSGTSCNAAGERTTPCCLADHNHSGAITVQDIFDFLAAYFFGGASADVNGVGGVTVQDIFDFLAAYFAGGC